jgi:hypothetical protein
MTSGRDVAAKFNWEKPTRVRLEYTGAFNRFKMMVLVDEVGSSRGNTIKEEVIDSDSEDDCVEIADYDHFERNVTYATANNKRCQVMVCSTKLILFMNITIIHLTFIICILKHVSL